VQDGPKGWGAKGVLDLNLIRHLAQEYTKSWKSGEPVCHTAKARLLGL
jgi:hypothetical protein